MTDAPTTQPATPESLNQQVRDLIETLRMADLHGVDLTAQASGLSEIQRSLAAHEVDAERMQVSLHPELRYIPGDPIAGGFTNAAEFFPYSPVVGPLNPMSMPATFEVVDDGIDGSVTFGARYNGPPGAAHGGMIALVLDEVLGSTALVAGVGGYTGTLSIRYQGTVPLDTEVELWGRLDRVEGRKAFVVGEIRLDGDVLVKCEGVFIRPADSPVDPASGKV